MPRPVELVRDQSPILSEKRIGLGHARDLLKGFTAESFGDLGQGGSLGIRQAESGGQVCSEIAILGCQVFVSEQQFLIYKTCDKGQNACPMESICHRTDPS